MLIGCTCKPDEYPALAKIGFDYAELPCRVVNEMSESGFAAFQKQAQDIGFPILGLNIYCPPEVIIAGPGFDAEAAAAYAHKAAARAKALGVRYVGVGSPKSRILPDGFDRGLARRQLIEFLRVTALEFGAKGMGVNMESLDHACCNFINTTKEAFDAAKEAGCENIGLVIDFYQMGLTGEGDRDLTDLVPLLRHAHISDDDGEITLRSYLHPERSGVHEKRVKRLAQTGYSGGLTLEIDIALDPERAAESLKTLREATDV